MNHNVVQLYRCSDCHKLLDLLNENNEIHNLLVLLEILEDFM